MSGTPPFCPLSAKYFQDGFDLIDNASWTYTGSGVSNSRLVGITSGVYASTYLNIGRDNFAGSLKYYDVTFSIRTIAGPALSGSSDVIGGISFHSGAAQLSIGMHFDTFGGIDRYLSVTFSSSFARLFHLGLGYTLGQVYDDVIRVILTDALGNTNLIVYLNGVLVYNASPAQIIDVNWGSVFRVKTFNWDGGGGGGETYQIDDISIVSELLHSPASACLGIKPAYHREAVASTAKIYRSKIIRESRNPTQAEQFHEIMKSKGL